MSPKVQNAIFLVIGAGLVILGAAAGYAAFSDHQLQSSYQSAPSCARLEDALAGNDCRYTGKATVASISDEVGTVGVYFAEADTTLIATFPGMSETVLQTPDDMQVELWSRHVTRVEDAITTDNPESIPVGILAWMGAILSGLGIGVLLWVLLVVRRRGVRPEDGPASPVGVMNPVAASDMLWR